VKTLSYPEYGRLEIAEQETPRIAPDEVLLHVAACGVCGSEPVSPMPAFREMTFATAGFGRIARAVLERARPFGFRLAAYDPFVAAFEFDNVGVQPLALDELFAHADILSLHLPLTPQTQHLANTAR
jgi:lactate dehydrogenase-like 2-hydroxyacid dehydrogenase